MITKYLTELLYDNECVMIPNFGAFITKNHSAVIDYVNNRFMPPYKEIVFNNKLNNDDNVLVDFICKKEEVSAEEASKMIKTFVNKCNAILDHAAELELQDFGTLRIDFKGEFHFEMKNDLNLLGDSFALTDFNVQPIFRSETYQLIKEQVLVEQKEKTTSLSSSQEANGNRSRYKLMRSILYSVAVFAIIFVINLTTDISGSQMASWNPFLYSSPNEFLINLIGANNEAKDVVAQEITSDIVEEAAFEEPIAEEVEDVCEEEIVPVVEETISQEPIIDEPITEEIVEVEEEPIVVKEYHYFIIGGSFQTQNSAEECLQIIKKQGFEFASILDKNDKGNIRVSYESFEKKADALIRLDEIKRDYNESAWLLFQK